MSEPQPVPPEVRNSRRAFWKGSVITGAVALLALTVVIAALLANRPSAASDVSAPAPTVTATISGPTMTATVTATVPGPETTVTVAAAPPAALNSCRAAIDAADKVISDRLRHQEIESAGLLQAARTGDPSVLQATTAQLKSLEPAEMADLAAYTSIRASCKAGS